MKLKAKLEGSMENTTELMTVDNICNRVYVIRGQQVMLDYDLAEIYGYEVKRLNEQVKRNINRFPEDFMFQLTKEEISEECLKSQIATLNGTENLKSQFATSSWGGKRKLPYAFTEQLLSQKKDGVEVILFTENGHGRKGFLTSEVVNDFINQYPPLRIKENSDCHDRLIVLDYGLSTEQVYHCGASSKDGGKKLCAINKIENTMMIHPVMDGLLSGDDKVI